MPGTMRSSAVIGRSIAVPMLVVATAAGAHTSHAPLDAVARSESYADSDASCRVANASYAVHFSAMQEGLGKHDRSRFASFCRELPRTGKTYLTIDLPSRDLRTRPVALRLVEDETASSASGRGYRQKSTLLDVPAKIYGSGTALIEAEITHPGDYALVVTIGEDGAVSHDRLHIPFRVRRPDAPVTSVRYRDFAAGMALIFYAAMAAIGYRAYRSHHPKATPGTAAARLAWQREVK